MTIGPYTVTRGAMVPFTFEATSPQIAVETEDLEVVVAEKTANSVEYIRAVIKEPIDNGMNISNYLKYGVRFKAIPFTVQDDYGTTWLVRFWDRRVKRRHLGGDLVELDLLFRIEVTQTP
jgi:hypothetical protein